MNKKKSSYIEVAKLLIKNKAGITLVDIVNSTSFPEDTIIKLLSSFEKEGLVELVDGKYKPTKEGLSK